ncbi:cytochrome P450 [Streptomyces sp. HNM0575]|uniref:cytochrome P450 n=1 Tax=Streptomyces sp. HNM0575 TaxID=2716338 RepID=UPI00145CA993|nr:cytochrome P450 [Streptomyces sp. HNM0575]NLU76571.1 cytochrome P450 [Streptomyces sp. HNM0575]
MTTGQSAPEVGVGHNPLGALMDHAIRADPYPYLAELRERGPFSVLDGSVVIFGEYEHCSQILRHRDMGSDTSESPMIKNFVVNEEDRAASSIFFMDPPGHGRQRKFISKSFTPRIVSGFESQIRKIVDGLFEDFIDKGELDVVSELAFPVSIGIICDLFDIPQDERHMLKEWSDDLALSTEMPTLGAAIGVQNVFSVDEINRFGSNAMAAHAYFADLIHRRRKNPGEDLVSSLLATESDGDRLTRHEVTSVLSTLFVAAHESTTNLISGGLLALLRNPDQLAILREDPSVISTLVDETLRYDPPVHLAARMAKAPATIGGYDLREGDIVVALMAAGNRDPRAYPDPDAYDVRRKPKPMSLAFGAGAHFCIGSSLAKLEAEIAISEFVQRLSDMELDESSLEYRRHIVVRGLERMCVSFKR